MIKYYQLKYRIRLAINILLYGETYAQRITGEVIEDERGFCVGLCFPVNRILENFKGKVITLTIGEN